jgi:acetylornithine/succinyldiaminopimelate/putrescine aminotransferase
VTGHDFAYILMKKGLLTKATHDYALRLAPALVIKEGEIIEAANIIKEGVKELEKLNDQRTQEKTKQ